MTRAILLALGLVLASLTGPVRAAEPVPGTDPATGFRMERYRAPVPDVLPGGQVLDTEAMRALAETPGRAVLIDVQPVLGAGPDPLDGTWRMAEPREDIAGSVWLPEVGRGFLEPDYERFFRRNLERLAKPGLPLVFYCTADCWQSWNAARRAILWGYPDVAWYPLGTDGWREAGLPLVPAEPVNFLEGE